MATRPPSFQRWDTNEERGVSTKTRRANTGRHTTDVSFGVIHLHQLDALVRYVDEVGRGRQATKPARSTSPMVML